MSYLVVFECGEQRWMFGPFREEEHAQRFLDRAEIRVQRDIGLGFRAAYGQYSAKIVPTLSVRDIGDSVAEIADAVLADGERRFYALRAPVERFL